jgi:hypothetical protein
MNDTIAIMDLIKYDPIKGCFVLRPEKKPEPLSPFLWKERATPSIFANDPRFTSKYKAGFVAADVGTNYKQFGTRKVFNKPVDNKHTT